MDRTCAHCSGDMTGKRSNAVYCTRTCKTSASDVRRRDDGRATARDRARYVIEAEHRKAYARQYLKDRPGYAKTQQLRRKARKQAVPNFVFTERDWRRLKERFRHACAYCGITGVPLQREHVIPLAKGGSHGPGNILPACGPCNYGKRTRFAIEWKLRLRRQGEVIAR